MTNADTTRTARGNAALNPRVALNPGVAERPDHAEPRDAKSFPATQSPPIDLPADLPIVLSTSPTNPKQSATSSSSRAGNTARPTAARRTAPERTGNRSLRQLTDALSERDLLVLRSVADHRFLTSRQVERLHFTSHASPVSAARTCRRVLRRLDEHRLLRHLDRRVGGVRAGSASYVWALGPVGDRVLRLLDDGRDTRRRSREPSERFLDHALAIAEAHLSLVELARSGVVDLTDVQTEPTCWRRYLGGGGQALTLQPDLFAVTAAGDYEDCWFLEIDLGNEHLPTIVRKCAQYETYRRTGTEQHERGVFPLVVWVMSSPGRVERLRAALHASPRIDDRLFRVTTLKELPQVIAGAAS